MKKKEIYLIMRLIPRKLSRMCSHRKMLIMAVIFLVVEMYILLSNSVLVSHKKRPRPYNSTKNTKQLIKMRPKLKSKYLKYSEDDFNHPLDHKYFSDMISDRIFKRIPIPFKPINPHPYKYLNVPKFSICNFTDNHSQTVTKNILVLVKSTVGNFGLRDIIRSHLWRNVDNTTIHRVFVLGAKAKHTPCSHSKKDHSSSEFKDDNSNTVQCQVDEENQIHGDIIQEDFRDTYRNNTLKTIMAFNWAVQYCSNVSFLVFMDDDFYAKITAIGQYLRGLPNSYTRNMFSGSLSTHGEPFRDLSFKWHMSYEQYKYDRFPHYLGGGAFVLSYDVALKFYHAFPYVQPIPVDDAYLGIVAHKVGVIPRMDYRFQSRSTAALARECSHNPEDILHQRCILSIPRSFRRKAQKYQPKMLLQSPSLFQILVFIIFLLITLICLPCIYCYC